MPHRAYLKSNPLHANPLVTKDDMQRAMQDLFAPLRPCFSPGKTGVRLGVSGVHYRNAAAEFEGFSRPLWGLAPLAAGGGKFDHWDVIRQGLVNGSDPEHREYWSGVGDGDQMIVESAALGFTLAIAPGQVWEPLNAAQRQNLGRWLENITRRQTPPNNWHFFPIMVALGLERVGWEVDWAKLEHHFEAIESYYLGDGWYRDGKGHQLDHYIGFAIHFYSLIYSKLKIGDDARREIYRQRATKFARHFKHWFASDGAALPFGRSLTYRFALTGFWAGLAFAGVEALPWGEIKGLLLSHLRWWGNQPISERDGVLSIGYAYPNLLMSEVYNSPGSPYWAAKAFAPLALPKSHPFWQADEIAPKPAKQTVSQAAPGMLLYGEDRNTIALSSGQETLSAWFIRHDAGKYAKFAYSTRYGFSVESDDLVFARGQGAFDNTLALSKNGTHYRVRLSNEDARIGKDFLYSRWTAWADVSVETWLIVRAPWHLRIHRITSPCALQTMEGGFALERTEANVVQTSERAGSVFAQTKSDFSGIRALADSAARDGVLALPAPNTNLMFARTMVPQLHGDINGGETVFGAAIIASPNVKTALRAWQSPPKQPDMEELEHLRDGAGPVLGWAAKVGLTNV